MSNDKTKWIFDESGDDPFGPEKTAPPGEMTETLKTGFRDPTFVGSNDPTVHLPGAEEAETRDKTEIYTRGNAARFESPAAFTDDSDPVTGWLVVVKGPGLGQSVPLGSGMNTIGRGSSARASLPFGDTLISSEDHIRIIYDDAEREFFVSHGSGKNISRVNGQLLANTLPLAGDARIDLSKVTTVIFKPFCGAGFDWSDIATADAPPD